MEAKNYVLHVLEEHVERTRSHVCLCDDVLHDVENGRIFYISKRKAVQNLKKAMEEHALSVKALSKFKDSLSL